MRRFHFLSLASVIMGFAALAAQEKTPTIVFDKQAANLGKMMEGEEVKHIFRFTNTGSATLEIFSVEPS